MPCCLTSGVEWQGRPDKGSFSASPLMGSPRFEADLISGPGLASMSIRLARVREAAQDIQRD
jgi:hypothetical protein